MKPGDVLEALWSEGEPARLWVITLDGKYRDGVTRIFRDRAAARGVCTTLKRRHGKDYRVVAVELLVKEVDG